MDDYAFQARSLVKRFGKTTALAGIDLAAREGTVLGVLGPNGAGKTTAIRILATLLRPDEGQATVAGLDVLRQPAEVRRLIGLTGQYASVDEDLTGLENLVLVGRLLNMRKPAAKERARGLLEDFGLADVATQRVSTYSGGMRRRLDLAVSMVGDPKIVFLDEPTSGLDPGKREDLWRTIRKIVAGGGTVLLTTQYLEEADALADEISVIDHGRVIAHGTPAELKQIVGGQAIALRPKDTAQASAAARVMASALGREPEAAGGVLTVPVDGDHKLTRLIHGLEDADIEAAELSLRLPSLDEVFFALTGRHTDTNDTNDANDTNDTREIA